MQLNTSGYAINWVPESFVPHRFSPFRVGFIRRIVIKRVIIGQLHPPFPDGGHEHLGHVHEDGPLGPLVDVGVASDEEDGDGDDKAGSGDGKADDPADVGLDVDDSG